MVARARSIRSAVPSHSDAPSRCVERRWRAFAWILAAAIVTPACKNGAGRIKSVQIMEASDGPVLFLRNEVSRYELYNNVGSTQLAVVDDVTGTLRQSAEYDGVDSVSDCTPAGTNRIWCVTTADFGLFALDTLQRTADMDQILAMNSEIHGGLARDFYPQIDPATQSLIVESNEGLFYSIDPGTLVATHLTQTPQFPHYPFAQPDGIGWETGSVTYQNARYAFAAPSGSQRESLIRSTGTGSTPTVIAPDQTYIAPVIVADLGTTPIVLSSPDSFLVVYRDSLDTSNHAVTLARLTFDGVAVWQRSLPSDLIGYARQRGNTLVLVIAGDGNQVLGLDLATGTQTWKVWF